MPLGHLCISDSSDLKIAHDTAHKQCGFPLYIFIEMKLSQFIVYLTKESQGPI